MNQITRTRVSAAPTALEQLRALELRYDGPIPREALAGIDMTAAERQVIARKADLNFYTRHCQGLIETLRKPEDQWRTFSREIVRNKLREALRYRRLLLLGWIEARQRAREAA